MKLTRIWIGCGVKGYNCDSLSHCLGQYRLQCIIVCCNNCKSVNTLCNQLSNNFNFLLCCRLFCTSVHTVYAFGFTKLSETNIHIDEDWIGQSLGNHNISRSIITCHIVRCLVIRCCGRRCFSICTLVTALCRWCTCCILCCSSGASASSQNTANHTCSKQHRN